MGATIMVDLLFQVVSGKTLFALVNHDGFYLVSPLSEVRNSRREAQTTVVAQRLHRGDWGFFKVLQNLRFLAHGNLLRLVLGIFEFGCSATT